MRRIFRRWLDKLKEWDEQDAAYFMLPYTSNSDEMALTIVKVALIENGCSGMQRDEILDDLKRAGVRFYMVENPPKQTV